MKKNSDLPNIESVGDLLKIMDMYLYSKRARWIYRGHSREEFKLLPSVGRLYGGKNFEDLSRLYQFEKSALTEFITRAFSKYRERNSLVNLAIARHHGLRTRLLDWTLSPLVALFFAVEDENDFEYDGAFFTYEQGDVWNSINFHPLDVEKYEEEYYFIQSPDLTPRISAQLGVFQLFKRPEVPFDEAFNLKKFIIKSEKKEALKSELFRLGISYDSIYPEVDGIARSINFQKLSNRNF